MQIKRLLGFLLLIPWAFNLEAIPLNDSQSRCYVQHFHPVLKTGTNQLGKVIIQNDNPNGFEVRLKSNNFGYIKAQEQEHGEVDIAYTLQFTQGSGEFGDNMTINLTETSLNNDHILAAGNTPTSGTDVSISIDLEITSDFQLLMAGYYKDTIEVEYINNVQ